VQNISKALGTVLRKPRLRTVSDSYLDPIGAGDNVENPGLIGAEAIFSA
jgi:hypothetical protein